jgi:hypothetical protein
MNRDFRILVAVDLQNGMERLLGQAQRHAGALNGIVQQQRAWCLANQFGIAAPSRRAHSAQNGRSWCNPQNRDRVVPMKICSHSTPVLGSKSPNSKSRRGVRLIMIAWRGEQHCVRTFAYLQ